MTANLQAEIARMRKEIAELAAAQTKMDITVRDVSVIEFATGPEYLGVRLFPAQGFLLKLIAGQTETFTPYDWALLDEWTQGFHIVEVDGHRRYAGTRGISPDVRDRLEYLKAHGGEGFGEVVFVGGRRFSKSYLAGITALYRLWQLLAMRDVQEFFDIDIDKGLLVPVISGSEKRAKRDQFGDIAYLIKRAPCFQPFIVERHKGSISLTTPEGLRRTRAGEHPPILIRIEAAETTALSARGPAVPISINDEVAHLTGAGSTSSFADIYAAIQPATVQFGHHALMWTASSPATMEGQFHDSYDHALAIDDHDVAVRPSMLMIQLESWAAYRDAMIAHQIPMWPDGPCYPRRRKPLLEYNDELRQLERENPETFAIEYRAQWARVLDAYLPSIFVDDLFAPFEGRTLVNNAPPMPGLRYYAHCDPSVSQAGFGFALGHTEAINGHQQLFYDILHSWDPRSFPGGRIDYEEIADQLFEISLRYRPEEISFDQFNSEETIQRLQKRLRDAGLNTLVYKATEKHHNNWANAEEFKTALGQQRVHAPRHPLAEAELRSLQLLGLQRVGAPRSGPTQTCDIADSMIAVSAMTRGDHKAEDIAAQFRAVRLSGTRLNFTPQAGPIIPPPRRNPGRPRGA